jgi:hypothetical protein
MTGPATELEHVNTMNRGREETPIDRNGQNVWIHDPPSHVERVHEVKNEGSNVKLSKRSLRGFIVAHTEEKQEHRRHNIDRNPHLPLARRIECVTPMPVISELPKLDIQVEFTPSIVLKNQLIDQGGISWTPGRLEVAARRKMIWFYIHLR